MRAVSQYAPQHFARRERYALGLLLIFLALWGGMLVHGYTHRELAPAVHQHAEDEAPHADDHCSACNITLPTLYATVSCYALASQTIYPPKYTAAQAAAPVLRTPTTRLGRAPPFI